MRIRITGGGYGLPTAHGVELKDRRSAPFEVDDAEAEALIAAGVAESAEFGAGVASRQSPEKVSAGADRQPQAAVGAPSCDGDRNRSETGADAAAGTGDGDGSQVSAGADRRGVAASESRCERLTAPCYDHNGDAEAGTEVEAGDVIEAGNEADAGAEDGSEEIAGDGGFVLPCECDIVAAEEPAATAATTKNNSKRRKTK